MSNFYLDYIPKLYSRNNVDKSGNNDNTKLEDKTITQLLEDSDISLNDEECYHLAYKIFQTMDCNINEKDKVKVSESFYHDLEVFGGHKMDQFNSIFDLLDKSHSNLGKIMLQHRIATPNQCKETLDMNQSITETLLDNPQLCHNLQKHFIKVTECERDTVWFWKEKNMELKELFSMVYFNNYILKELNYSEIVLRWYNYLKIIIYPLYGLLSPLLWLFISYYVSKHWIGIPVGFWDYCKMSYRGLTDMRLLSMAFNISPVILNVARYVYIFMTVSVYLYNLYMTFEMAYNLNRIINMIHQKVNKLSSYVVNCYHIYDLMKTIVPCKHNQEMVFIKDLYGDLWNDLFRMDPYLVSDKGKILKTFYSFDKGKDLLVYLMQYVAEVDTHLNVCNLIKHNGYHLVNYKHDADKPYINVGAMWNPCIEKNKVVKNDIQIGGELIEQFEDNQSEESDDKETSENESENESENDSKVEDIVTGKIVDLPNNILVTGPNAAGKSTFIKSIALSVLLGQTLGIAPAEQMEMSRFGYLSTYLNIPDTKGEKSLFQAEMEQVYQHIKQIDKMDNQFSFIIMDEIFNSTNYYEGVSGAYAIGNKLGKYSNNLTILTTHYPYLTKLSNTGKYQNYHFDAQLVDNKIVCDYIIKEGVSGKGIALELLKLKGFDNEMVNDAKEIYQDLMDDGKNDDNNDENKKIL